MEKTISGFFRYNQKEWKNLHSGIFHSLEALTFASYNEACWGNENAMKFYPITEVTVAEEKLREEYGKARIIDKVRVGDSVLFLRKGLRTVYAPFTAIPRIFRRVRAVNVMMCCDSGEMELEYLVLSDGTKELIEVQLPTKHAAQILLRELRERMPDTAFGVPASDVGAAV